MKNKRRHDLQTNELADWIGRYVEKVRPYIKTISAVIVLVVVVFLIATVINYRQSAKAASAWSSYIDAQATREAEQLEGVNAKHPGTAAAMWAMQRAGDLYFSQASRDIYIDRDDAKKNLESARDAYEKVVGSTNNELKLKATIGLAKVHESLCATVPREQIATLEKAREYYQKVLELCKETDSTAFKSVAEQRLSYVKEELEHLDKDTSKSFYHWFARQKPKVPGIDPLKGLDIPGLNSGDTETKGIPFITPGNNDDTQEATATPSDGKSEETKTTDSQKPAAVEKKPAEGTPAPAPDKGGKANQNKGDKKATDAAQAASSKEATAKGDKGSSANKKK